MLAVTLPMWPQWWAERERWSTLFAGHTSGLSAGGILIPFAVVGLVLLGRRRAAWLVIPALLPDTQLYYAVLALPVVAAMPLVALAIAVPVPRLIVVGMLGQAAANRLTSGSPQVRPR